MFNSLTARCSPVNYGHIRNNVCITYSWLQEALELNNLTTKTLQVHEETHGYFLWSASSTQRGQPVTTLSHVYVRT